MPILFGAIVLCFIIFFFLNVWPWKNPVWESAGWAAMVALTVGAFFGSIGWAIAVGMALDEVDVEFPIYEGPSGRYLEDGTTGEINSPITIYYFKENGVLRKSWQDSGSTGINTTTGEPFAFMTCPSSETLPDWLKMPWELDENHEFTPNCDEEFITFYIPEGES